MIKRGTTITGSDNINLNEEMDIESEEFILYVMKRFKYSRDAAEIHRDNILNKLKEDK